MLRTQRNIFFAYKAKHEATIYQDNFSEGVRVNEMSVGIKQSIQKNIFYYAPGPGRFKVQQSYGIHDVPVLAALSSSLWWKKIALAISIADLNIQ